jgi:uncharacterized membrane protein
MNAANTDDWKEVVGRIRTNVAVCAMTLSMLGFQLAAAMWKPHDVFYPFPFILWGFFTLVSLLGAFRYLNQLSYSRNQEEKKAKKAKTRRLMAYILCAMLVWFSFAVCLAAAKIFGKLYIVSAAVMGIFMICMGLVTDGEIRRIASCFINPQNESIS